MSKLKHGQIIELLILTLVMRYIAASLFDDNDIGHIVKKADPHFENSIHEILNPVSDIKERTKLWRRANREVKTLLTMLEGWTVPSAYLSVAYLVKRIVDSEYIIAYSDSEFGKGWEILSDAIFNDDTVGTQSYLKSIDKGCKNMSRSLLKRCHSINNGYFKGVSADE